MMYAFYPESSNGEAHAHHNEEAPSDVAALAVALKVGRSVQCEAVSVWEGQCYIGRVCLKTVC